MPLRKASAQFRREIAELKRRNSKARAEIAGLQRRLSKEVSPSVTEVEKIRFSARSVKAQRKRLVISAADYGKLVGVSAVTVYSWEHGISRPRKAQVAALAAVRRLGKTEVRKRLEEMRRKTPKGRNARKRSTRKAAGAGSPRRK